MRLKRQEKAPSWATVERELSKPRMLQRARSGIRDAVKNGLKCFICKDRRQGLSPHDGWYFHFHVGLCPTCALAGGDQRKVKALHERMKQLGKMNGIVMAMDSGTTDFETFPCQRCGAAPGKDCEDNCEAYGKGHFSEIGHPTDENRKAAIGFSAWKAGLL